MKREYEISVLCRDYLVVFEFIHNVLGLGGRMITTCTIVELPEKKIYSGSSIKNPNDLSNYFEGMRYAYKRAVFFLWMVYCDNKKCGMPFFWFWQNFRKGLGRNPEYLKDRKEK